MELNSRLNSFSLVWIPQKRFNLSLNEKIFSLKKEKSNYSISIKRIQKNIIDFNIYSLLDGRIFFKNGGYYS